MYRKELQPASVIKNFERLSCRDVGRERAAAGSGQGEREGFLSFLLTWIGLVCRLQKLVMKSLLGGRS